jgi:hypothetical protein
MRGVGRALLVATCALVLVAICGSPSIVAAHPSASAGGVTAPETKQQDAKQVRARMSRAGCSTHVPRATKDRRDVVKGRQVHVVYVMPTGFIETPDFGLDTKGTIACSLRAMNEWMIDQTNGMGWNFDMFRMPSKRSKPGRLEIDITFLQSTRTGDQLYTATHLKDELTAKGFDDPDKRYLAFVFQTAPPCADAIYPSDPMVPATWQDGKYANVNFLSRQCPGYFGVPGETSAFEAVVLQALLKTDGVVDAGAPHGCPTDPGYVCTPGLGTASETAELDPQHLDLMYLPSSTPLEDRVLDIDHDDYFGHSWNHIVDLEDSPYLVDLGKKRR